MTVPWKILASVNYNVNCMLAYQSDQSVHGKPECWQKPSETMRRKTGDCEDYAILKAWILVSQHRADPATMRIAVVKRPGAKTLHAVLLVPGQYTTGFWRWKKTHDCSWVLDNMNDDLKRWTQTDYEMIRLHSVERFFDAA